MAKDRREEFNLVCKKCGNYNYSKKLNRGDDNDLELNKFCNFCREHTSHKAKKISSARK